jgi:crotonobetainyl-CoA:carnitine CoA-transferase CaiB-like acyl-CoA transferase
VDASIVDGVSSLATMFYGFMAAGMWKNERASNSIDSGSHFCNVYECSDHRYITISPVEGRFHDLLLDKLGLNKEKFGNQMDAQSWPKMIKTLSDIFKTKTQQEWCELLEGSDVCFAPVLTLEDAHLHPHMAERETLVTVDGVLQPNAFPRFEKTPLNKPTPPKSINAQNTRLCLSSWLNSEQMKHYTDMGVIE